MIGSCLAIIQGRARQCSCNVKRAQPQHHASAPYYPMTHHPCSTGDFDDDLSGDVESSGIDDCIEASLMDDDENIDEKAESSESHAA